MFRSVDRRSVGQLVYRSLETDPIVARCGRGNILSPAAASTRTQSRQLMSLLICTELGSETLIDATAATSDGGDWTDEIAIVARVYGCDRCDLAWNQLTSRTDPSSFRYYVRPSVRPSVLHCVRPSVRPSISPSVRPFVPPSFLPSVRPHVRPSVRPSACPSIRLMLPSGRRYTKNSIIDCLLTNNLLNILKLKRSVGWTVILSAILDGRTYTDGRTNWRTYTDGRTDSRTDGWTDGRTDGRTNGRTDGWTNGWTCGRTDRRANGRMDWRTDARTDEQTEGWKADKTGERNYGRKDERTDGRTDGWMDGRTDQLTNGRTDGWTEWRTDEVRDGRTDRWTDGRNEGRTDERLSWQD